MKNHKITLAQQILNKACSKSNFTFDLTNNKNRYIVSCNNLFTGINPSLQFDLISTISNSINLRKFDSLGGWFDPKTKIYYLDTNLHFQDLKIALLFAKENKQIAIFDQKTKTTIYLNNKI